MADTWDYSGPLDGGPIPVEWVWERLRLRRDQLLAASDPLLAVDSPVDRPAWQAYRQALRDLPQVTTDPRQAVWPDPPAPDPVPGAAQNADTIRAQATAALTGNRDFLDLSAPTNAQTLAQVKALTRQSTGVIRLLLGVLDATD